MKPLKSILGMSHDVGSDESFHCCGVPEDLIREARWDKVISQRDEKEMEEVRKELQAFVLENHLNENLSERRKKTFFQVRNRHKMLSTEIQSDTSRKRNNYPEEKRHGIVIPMEEKRPDKRKSMGTVRKQRELNKKMHASRMSIIKEEESETA
ncbi:hypothetical protein O181_042309 [Austropuccinia psidii MF-1]|uniref:Uncharacterized protein n=1 Tax=Austropuccinia psidii MF-1 TaxID=1389203 RepID=A0A9Q3DFW2_9BASI|nr:hypothetical protein [Austropuccinia psidii MF-1]